MATTDSVLAGYTKSTNEISKKLDNTVSYGFDDMDSTVSTVGAGVQMFSSLASVYTGFKQLELAEEELEMKKEQMAAAMNEATRARNVTSNLTAAFG